MSNVDILQNIVIYNEGILESVGGDQDKARDKGYLWIESYGGQEVYDFFLDETLRDEVDPYEYYPKEELDRVVKAWQKGNYL